MLLLDARFRQGVQLRIDETHLANEAARWAVVITTRLATAWVLSQADTPELRNGGSSSVPAKAQVCISFPTNAQTGTSEDRRPVNVTVSVYNWLPFVGGKINR